MFSVLIASPSLYLVPRLFFSLFFPFPSFSFSLCFYGITLPIFLHRGEQQQYRPVLGGKHPRLYTTQTPQETTSFLSAPAPSPFRRRNNREEKRREQACDGEKEELVDTRRLTNILLERFVVHTSLITNLVTDKHSYVQL